MTTVFSPFTKLTADEFRRATEVTYLGTVHGTIAALRRMIPPQFDLARTRMPRRPRPVPPIFQPEVAADAIVWAASQRRREVYVGGSTVLAVMGQRVAPRLGDLYLARKGYDAQMDDDPVDESRPDNLYEPVPGDHGAHGRFDVEARRRSFQLSLTKHRLWLALGGLALAAAVRRR